MSEQQSPDGQQTSNSPSDGDAGGTTEPIRDWSEAKRIIAQRDGLRAERDRLQKERDDLLAKQTAAERAKAEAEGNLRGLVDSLQNELKAKEAATAEIASKLAERERRDRRRDFTDVILQRTHEQHREEVRLILSGLHEDGEIDLYAEDTKPAAIKAAEKLAKRYPEKFRPHDGAPQGGTQAPAGKTIPEGVAFQDLPPDMQRSMSDEEFKRRYGRGGRVRSGLAF